MEIKALRRDLEDLKRKHQSESDVLRENACAWDLTTISHTKSRMEVLRKKKQSIINKIDKLQPTLI